MSNFTQNSITCDSKKLMSLVNCVGEAVGNDIKDDMNGLITDNSEPERIWDILNTKLYNKMNSLSCVADVTKRGRWKMVPVFDKETGLLYTFMRESRYDELKRQLERGARNTYLNQRGYGIF